MSENTAAAPKTSHVRDVILLFSVPAVVALLAAIAVYLPKSLANPRYAFIYSYCGDYGCDGSYVIDANGKLQRNTPTATTNRQTGLPIINQPKSALLGLYDPKTDSTKLLTYEQAQDYQLINSSRSPDGYRLEFEYGGGGGFFLGGDYDTAWVLKNGWKKREIHLNGQMNTYSESATLVGWVKQ